MPTTARAAHIDAADGPFGRNHHGASRRSIRILRMTDVKICALALKKKLPGIPHILLGFAQYTARKKNDTLARMSTGPKTIHGYPTISQSIENFSE